MSYENELQSTVEQIAQSPKTLATVSATTATLGAAGMTSALQGWLSIFAILAGVIATALLCRVHWAKYQNERLQNRILKQQLLDMGIAETDS